MKETFNELVRLGRFVPPTRAQRFGYAIGGLLVLSGVAHAGVYLVDGGAWEGPLSWRKPIVFGLSFGITLMTLAWLMGFLRPGRRTAWVVLGVFAFASLGEVALISMQTWRGVASHFNDTTAFDGAVFSAMGMLVSIVALITVFVTVWTFIRVDAPTSLAIAIRLGLVLMLVSQGVGVQMIVEGDNTYGAAGAFKVPHAITLHAVQVLPALALVLLASASSERRRVSVVCLGAAGYAAMIASTMIQTYGGRAPLDLGLATTALAVLGLALLATAAGLGILGLVRRSGSAVTGSPSAPSVGVGMKP